MAEEADRHHCDQCERSFQRPEHLKRHRQSHSESKPFACPVCSKAFLRSDTLSRHEIIHTHSLERVVVYSAGTQPGKLQRNRACTECAKARARCSKGDPCSRCSSRSIHCEYPNRHKRRRNSDGRVSRTENVDYGGCSSSSEEDGLDQPRPATVHSLDSAACESIFIQENEPSPFVQAASEMNLPSLDQLPFGTVGDGSDYVASRRGHKMDNADGTRIVLCGTNVRSAYNLTSPYNPSQVDRRDPVIDERASQVVPQSSLAGLEALAELQAGTPGRNDQGGYQMSYATEIMDTAFDGPLNWLPTNYTTDIDYTSILGLGSGSLPVFGESGSSLPPRQAQVINEFHNVVVDQHISSVAPSEHLSTTSEATSVGSNQITSPAHIEPLPLNSAKSSRGALYATSTDGARAPCTFKTRTGSISIHERDRISPEATAGSRARDQGHILAFPDLTNILIEGYLTNADILSLINPLCYEDIKGAFRRLCLVNGSIFPAFQDTEFPLSAHLNYFAYLYFEHFHPIFPILHKASINLNDYWPLALAVAAIGSHYTSIEEFSRSIFPMHEFLRRVVYVELENRNLKRLDFITLQTTVLSHIGMLYSESRNLSRAALEDHGRLISAVHQYQLLNSPQSPLPLNRAQNDWQAWVALESQRRLGYAIWLLDYMRQYQFNLKPCLSLADATAPLPSDGLWYANTEAQWQEIYREHKENPSLSSAIQGLYVDGDIKSDVGEFSRVLILHGVYHEMWEVGRYFQRPLCFWQSSAKSGQSNGNLGTQFVEDTAQSRWLPKISTYSNWRNSACDCIDVLHWAANSTIAQLNGAEHPTVFHLHFSRTVLLVPYEKIRALAVSLTSKQLSTPSFQGLVEESTISEAEHEVLQWAQRDEHKARLAVLHAAALFWHARRYSRGAFYEPAGTFLATLTLWAYSSYTPLARPTNRSKWKAKDRPKGTTAATPREEVNTQPTFIHLDRPMDDEMVQMFVRSGHPSQIKAFIAGVGHICEPDGPGRILKEGIKILAEVAPTWGCAKEYISILDSLESVVGRNGSSSSSERRRDLG